MEKIKNALFTRRRKALTAQAEADRIKALNNAYFRCFDSEAGRKVLDDMIQRYSTVPIAQKGDTPMDVGEKQGRANVVSEIIARMTANQ